MDDTELAGLSSEEARRRLLQLGPNAIAEGEQHLLLALLTTFWAPVPWMLEATIILELLLHKRFEALIILALLVFNAGLSFFQETRARNALTLLRKRLVVEARVKRDGRWTSAPAEQSVPGDLIHIRMGDLTPADIRVISGWVSLDESTLTGEALPVDRDSNGMAYAGSMVRRGDTIWQNRGTGSHRRHRQPSPDDPIALAIIAGARRYGAGRQSGSDQCRPVRYRRRGRNQPPHLSADADLHTEQDHQNHRDRILRHPGRDDDPPIHHRTVTDRAAALHQGLRHYVDRHRPRFFFTDTGSPAHWSASYASSI
ncbi:MAG TPA: cation-transporting P-type ATPase [Candidatus Binataceae bacterium]|nr:cation-transporting P-type ATPase [Candidatus Binataceae bacterium]